MKKLAMTLFIALVFVFSTVPVLADGEGEIPIMGVTCGIPGKPVCPPPPGLAEPNEDTNYYKTLLSYLAGIFG